MEFVFCEHHSHGCPLFMARLHSFRTELADIFTFILPMDLLDFMECAVGKREKRT